MSPLIIGFMIAMVIGGVVLGLWGAINLPIPAELFNLESAGSPDAVRMMVSQSGLVQELLFLQYCLV